MFQQVFSNELQKLGLDIPIIDNLWDEIKLNYNGPDRYYHNIHHLNNLVEQLLPVKNEIEDWPTLIFSVAYHDIIYDTRRTDNEEQSAILANERLIYLEQSPDRKEKCRQQILATKGHQVSDDPDTNYFTDADLSILGADSSSYLEYTRQIRKEYEHYPDPDYKKGRAAVLTYFLNMKSLFKTEFFKDRFEKQARLNMQNELSTIMLFRGDH